MTSPVHILLDTDMGNDIDDALALAMLHALDSRGECRLLAVSVSKDNPYAPAFVDAVNTFYGRGRIPVGCVRNGVTPLPEHGNFIEEVVKLRDATGAARFPTNAAHARGYPDAVELLRAQLARARPQSVVAVMIGFSTNMARLLGSGPDAHSALDGHALFARAVKHVVMMAGDFSPQVQAHPTLENREYNIHRDIESAQRFIHLCPRPIYFSGWEIGTQAPYPARAIAEDFARCAHHPVVEAYRRFLPMPYDRPSWDLTAVLFAVRPDEGYFGLSAPGRALVDGQGIVRFAPDTQGPHRHLIWDETQRARIEAAHRALSAQPPTDAPDENVLSPCARSV